MKYGSYMVLKSKVYGPGLKVYCLGVKYTVLDVNCTVFDEMYKYHFRRPYNFIKKII